jgi:hypothetical protein
MAAGDSDGGRMAALAGAGPRDHDGGTGIMMAPDRIIQTRMESRAGPDVLLVVRRVLAMYLWNSLYGKSL